VTVRGAHPVAPVVDSIDVGLSPNDPARTLIVARWTPGPGGARSDDEKTDPSVHDAHALVEATVVPTTIDAGAAASRCRRDRPETVTGHFFSPGALSVAETLGGFAGSEGRFEYPLAVPSCPKCETRYSGGARLCRNCGGPLLTAESTKPTTLTIVLPADGIRVCARCGVCVPASRERCELCKDPPAPRTVPPRSDGAYWVRASCGFRCRSCGVTGVPFGRFDHHGACVCGLCGAANENPSEMATMYWRTLLQHLHAVGDLAGPHPEGRHAGAKSIAHANPFKQVGLDVTTAVGDRVRDDGESPSNLEAQPGYPLCAGCSEPVDAAWTGGALHCSCGRGGWGVRPALAARVDVGLVAILQQDVRGRPTGAAAEAVARPASEHAGPLIALTCPTCSAPLTVVPDATTVTCAFCKTSSLLVAPPGSATRDTPQGQSEAEVERWAEEVRLQSANAFWLLFTGPSKQRASLQARTG